MLGAYPHTNILLKARFATSRISMGDNLWFCEQNVQLFTKAS